MLQFSRLESLSVSIDQLKGVGVRRGAVLRQAGICSIRDLLFFLPRRYLDRSTTVDIADLPLGEEVTLLGRVRKLQNLPGSPPRFHMVIGDETAELACVWFHGAGYLRRNFSVGDELALSGKVDFFQGCQQMVHPEYEFVSDCAGTGFMHTGRIIPLYTTSSDMKETGLRNRGFRRLIRDTLDYFAEEIRDDLPAELISRLDLLGLGDSLQQVHFPDSKDAVRRARRRLAFDELFNQQLRFVQDRQLRMRRQDGISFGTRRLMIQAWRESLPFTLTGAQDRVIQEVIDDMAQSAPMHRLLQGDVGSGKTLVAMAAILNAVDNGYQAVLMAPTEILAEQHFGTVRKWVEPLGITVVYLVGGQAAKLRRELLHTIATGSASIIVGTHALIQEDVKFLQLGLVVIDEEQRFGVAQRADLRDKGKRIDALVMTATPIPRTLAMANYGDLDFSVLDQLPPGRRPVRTVWRPAAQRQRIFAFAAEEIRAGRQIYVVYPLIGESDKSDMKSAKQGYDELRGGLLEGCVVALLHGQMDRDERSAVMDGFKNGEIQVLVSTTVIEVGLDVPNATIVVIEHAERFGLAQLHQLRGRVGRGTGQSYCILVTYVEGGGEAWERLNAICQSHDGFHIAQRDLELRGPGDIYGNRQSGLPEFAVADLLVDEDLLLRAKREACRLLAPEEHTGG